MSRACLDCTARAHCPGLPHRAVLGAGALQRAPHARGSLKGAEHPYIQLRRRMSEYSVFA